MHTDQAKVLAQLQGRSQVIPTEVWALNLQDARWLLWAQWGFHSIQSGPGLGDDAAHDGRTAGARYVRQLAVRL